MPPSASARSRTAGFSTLAACQVRLSSFTTIVAIGSLPVLVLELRRDDLVAHDRVLVDVVNAVVLFVFVTNYLLGLYVAEDRRAFVRREKLQLLLVVSQAVVFLPEFDAFGILRAIRATRLVRVAASMLRLIAIGGIASSDGRRALQQRATPFALGIAGMTWLSSAVAFTVAEDVGPDGRVESFFDSLWWSLTTMTTVGYGDVFPITTGGRIVGVMTMIVGVAVFAVVTARIAEFFASGASADQSPARFREPIRPTLIRASVPERAMSAARSSVPDTGDGRRQRRHHRITTIVTSHPHAGRFVTDTHRPATNSHTAETSNGDSPARRST